MEYTGMSGIQSAGFSSLHQSAMPEIEMERRAELDHLQEELQANKTEETRIRQALQVHESVIYKNREELNRYREYMETRDDEMRKMMQIEVCAWVRRYNGCTTIIRTTRIFLNYSPPHTFFTGGTFADGPG